MTTPVQVATSLGATYPRFVRYGENMNLEYSKVLGMHLPVSAVPHGVWVAMLHACSIGKMTVHYNNDVIAITVQDCLVSFQSEIGDIFYATSRCIEFFQDAVRLTRE